MHSTFLSWHELAAISSTWKIMCGMKDSETHHKESSKTRIQSVQYIVHTIIQKMINPFQFETCEHTAKETNLVNISTGLVAPVDVTTDLLNARKNGRAYKEAFY